MEEFDICSFRFNPKKTDDIKPPDSVEGSKAPSIQDIIRGSRKRRKTDNKSFLKRLRSSDTSDLDSSDGQADDRLKSDSDDEIEIMDRSISQV